MPRVAGSYGHAQCPIRSCPVSHPVMPSVPYSHAQCPIRSCPVSLPVMPSVPYGDAQCPIWSCPVSHPVMPSVPYGHAQCPIQSCPVSHMVMPSVPYGHAQCSGFIQTVVCHILVQLRLHQVAHVTTALGVVRVRLPQSNTHSVGSILCGDVCASGGG